MFGLPTIQSAGGGFTAPDWQNAQAQQSSSEYMPPGQNLLASEDGFLVGNLEQNNASPALTIGYFDFYCWGTAGGYVSLFIPVCIPIKKGTAYYIHSENSQLFFVKAV